MILNCKKFLLIFSFIVFCILLIVLYNKALSYDSNIAHPYLTEEAIEAFNNNSEIEISKQEIEWLKQGAVEEDAIPRWMNHFYNPITSNGLGVFSSAKVWAQSPSLQKVYFLFKGDQTWQKAISSYTKGDKKEAFIALGHILHLAEDMTVPAHTRNDAHPEGDPYENWVKDNNERDFENISIIKLNSLDEFFDGLAQYSGEYFFSKDTINTELIKNLKTKIFSLDNKIIDCFLYYDNDNKEFCIISSDKNFINPEKRVYYLTNLNHSDYYSLLAPKAISYGAGLIDLFFREAEIEKQKQQEKSWLDNLKDIFSSPSQPAGPGFLTEDFSTLNNSLTDQTTDNSPTNQMVDNSDAIVEPLMPSNNNPPSVQNAHMPDFDTGTRSNTNNQSIIIASNAPQNVPDPTPGVIEPRFSLDNASYPGFGGGGAPAPKQDNPEEIPILETAPVAEPESEPEPETVPEPETDTTPPDISFLIAECGQNNCLLFATTTLHISWLSNADDLDYFEFTQNNTISTTTATSTEVIVSDNSKNTFSARAKDLAGNLSDLKISTIEVSSVPVVINEVAWAGTSASNSSDEWIELYNRTNHDINFNNDDWVLYSQTDMSPYINLSGVIPAKGYFLVERTDDDTISDILADQIYTGDLKNSGEVLVLTNASTTIDQAVLCTPGSVTWCPGYDYKYATMERKSPDISGTDKSNWGYNNDIIKNGKDANDNLIKGTPKARNSINYLLNNNQNILFDTVLTKENSPYFVGNKSANILIQIKNGVTITIEPGVVIKFYSGKETGIDILDGKIIAQGTEAEPIVFTTFFDDEYGGDLNKDATSTSPFPGSWRGIGVMANGSIFDHTIFRYGGKYYTGQMQSKSNLSIENSSATITNSTFEYSKVYGLKLINSDSVVSGNTIRNNNNENDPSGINAGFAVSEGNPIVSNNTIMGNKRGVYSFGSGVNFNSNNFDSNDGEAVWASGPLGNFTNNFGSNNSINGIVFLGGITEVNSSLTLGINDLPYVIKTNGATVVASSTLIMPKGTILKTNEKLIVNGNLIIDGENPEDIILTSLYDDTVGGDTTNDATSSLPTRGNFRGIEVASTGSLNARGFTARYAGSVAYGGDSAAGIRIDGSLANISNAVFNNNYPHGVYVANSSSVVIENAKFENHDYTGVWGTKAALAVYNSSTTLNNVSFENNLLGIISDTLSSFAVTLVEFVNNIATTTPAGLW